MNEQLIASIKNLLEGMGEEPDREGLLDTPKRYISFLESFFEKGYEDFNFTTFANDGSNEMIVVKDIDFYSLCEHHMVPFFGKAHVAYIPHTRIVGLSKIPRTVERFANRLQNQERITKQIAEFLSKELAPRGVAVVLEARHLCMEMRGIRKTACNTTTSAMYGTFQDEVNCRQEFLSFIKK